MEMSKKKLEIVNRELRLAQTQKENAERMENLLHDHIMEEMGLAR